MRSALIPFSFVYDQITQVRNVFYDRGWLQSFDSEKPVISVGNLTMGGTGKTPLISLLVKWAHSQKLKSVLITRGYGSQISTSTKMSPQADPKIFGDEPVMLQKKHPQLPIYVGGDRICSIKKLLKAEEVDIIFADDAFQHRKMRRDVDIVVMDATESLHNYEVLPLGRARESLKSLVRADIIVLSKANLVNAKKIGEIRNLIKQGLNDKHVPIIEFDYFVNKFFNLHSNQFSEIENKERIILMSGIGNPAAFESLLKQKTQVVKHFVFKDHHPYTRADLVEPLGEAQKNGIKKIVVTEKDAVKLKPLIQGDNIFWVTELEPQLNAKANTLYEYILSKIR